MSITTKADQEKRGHKEMKWQQNLIEVRLEYAPKQIIKKHRARWFAKSRFIAENKKYSSLFQDSESKTSEIFEFLNPPKQIRKVLSAV